MARTSIEPQQERSSETRRRILAAAIECLTSLGYAATTTTIVGERAAVSRGALLYHFPTRQQLVSGAVAQLFDDLRSRYQRSFARLAPRGSRLDAAVDLLWKSLQDERLQAVLELWVVARTDSELQAQLSAVSKEHHRHIRELARAFFPEDQSDERFDAIVNLLIDTLQGAAVRKLARGDDPSIRQSVTLVKELVAAALSSSAKE